MDAEIPDLAFPIHAGRVEIAQARQRKFVRFAKIIHHLHLLAEQIRSEPKTHIAPGAAGHDLARFPLATE